MNNEFKPGDIISPISYGLDYSHAILLLEQLNVDTFKYCYIIPKNSHYLIISVYNFRFNAWKKLNE